MSTPPPQKNKSEHFSLLLEQLLYLDGSGSCTYAPWGRIESSSNSAEAWSECRGYKSGSGFISVIQSHITATRGQFCLCTAVNMEEDLKSVSKPTSTESQRSGILRGESQQRWKFNRPTLKWSNKQHSCVYDIRGCAPTTALIWSINIGLIGQWILLYY